MTVGMPNRRILPLSLGISTLFTGFGRYEPSSKERIRASLLAKSQGGHLLTRHLVDTATAPVTLHCLVGFE